MNVVLYQPDIALNVGAIIRLCACLDVRLHIVEPCGFPFDMKKVRQSALDYIDKIELIRHVDWEAFTDFHKKHKGTLYLLSTKADVSYSQAFFKEDDYLIFGRESSGAGKEVWSYIDKALKIPLRKDCRSLNLASSVAIVLGESLRQTSYIGLE